MEPKIMTESEDQSGTRKSALTELFSIENIRSGKSLQILDTFHGIEGLCKYLETSVTKGISTDLQNLNQRISLYGTNIPDIKPSKSFCSLIFDQLSDFIIRILILSAIVSLVIGMSQHPDTGWMEGTVILLALTIVVLVSATNDYMKELQFVKLNQETDVTPLHVTREGEQIEIYSNQLLVGDIIHLGSGSIVPADGIVVRSAGLLVDESSLTGESEPRIKSVLFSSMQNANPFLISGSMVIEGNGTMLVCAVGSNSQSGRNNEMLKMDDDETPLQEKLEVIAEHIGKLGFATALCLFFAFLIYTIFDASEKQAWDSDCWDDLLDGLILAITIIVVAIPEGLPLAVTLALAYSVIKMKDDKIFVRHLKACETMGAASVILSDKTGTLTQNKMTVVQAFVYDQDLDLESPQLSSAAKMFLCENLVRNNSASLQISEEQIKYIGNRTDAALLKQVYLWNIDFNSIRNLEGEVFQLAFSSTRKRMTTVNSSDLNNNYVVYCKGAAESVIDTCKFYIDENLQIAPLQNNKIEAIKRKITEYANQQLRVIALAYKTINSDELPSSISDARAQNLEQNLNFVGLIGIQDLIRPGVQKVVQQVQKSGIKVIMVTGDNMETAIKIAEQASIIPKTINDADKFHLAMEGPTFTEQVGGLQTDTNSAGQLLGYHISDIQTFKQLTSKIRVFARCSPTDKLVLVTGFKQLGEVVSVTGDGSNDALALKRADVGLAMMSGTSMAKEASDIILLDDNFTSIANSVVWGRNVYASIRKFLQFQLTVNIVALVISLVCSIVIKSSPFTAVEMLWVNLIMDSLAALALATEPPNKGLLYLQPHTRDEYIILPDMIINIAVMSVYQLTVLFLLIFLGHKWLGYDYGWQYDDEYSESKAKHYTVVFNTFVMMQLFNEINCRKLSMGEINVFKGFCNNYLFIVILILTLIVQVVLVQFGGEPLNCSPLELWEHGLCIGIGATCLVINLLMKIVVALFRKDSNEMNKEEVPLLKNNQLIQQNALPSIRPYPSILQKKPSPNQP